MLKRPRRDTHQIVAALLAKHTSALHHSGLARNDSPSVLQDTRRGSRAFRSRIATPRPSLPPPRHRITPAAFLSAFTSAYCREPFCTKASQFTFGRPSLTTCH